MHPVLPRAAVFGVFAALVAATPASADVVVPDDQIVQGSVCAGPDCVNNESFGFDTVRLKGPALRLAFTDTSSSVGFPTTDDATTTENAAAVDGDALVTALSTLPLSSYE